jgi:hypothetical protein
VRVHETRSLSSGQSPALEREWQSEKKEMSQRWNNAPRQIAANTIVGSRYDVVGNEYLGAEEVAELVGAWQDIVGQRRPGGMFAPPGAAAWGHAPYRGHPQGAPYGYHYGRGPGMIPPRNALINRRGPNRADRILLPMSSSGNITGAATITARPQNVAYRPERVVIGGTPGNWIVNDIKVGNRSQLSQAGELPGEAFANTAVDTFISFETVQTAMDFVVQVTYAGAVSGGETFRAAVFGTAAIGG